MKVLHLINNLGSGGAEKLLVDLIPLMSKRDDVEADILLLTDKNNVFYDILASKNIKVEVIKYKNLYDPRNIFEIKKKVVEGNYDIVHSHTFPTQYWVALSRILIKNKKVKFITTEHNTYNRRREIIYLKFLDKFIYSNYDLIISITDKTRSNLIKWVRPSFRELGKYVVLENGVDLGIIRNATSYKKVDLISGISEDTKLVCMIGRFTNQKDQPTLIRAISSLPENIHLILVGEGSLIINNQELAAKLGVVNRVHFLGFRHDIPKILKTIDIVVLSSNWEGFGLAAVEGMAAKKPLLASNVDGLREVVKDFGIIFNNEKELVYQIKTLLSDDVFYDRISKLCFLRAQKYDITEMLNNLFDLYMKILN